MGLQEAALQALLEYDKDESGTLSFDEFLPLFAQMASSQCMGWMDEVDEAFTKEMFDAADEDGSGKFSIEGL